MQPKQQTELFVEDAAPVRLDTGGEVWVLEVDPTISWDAARAHVAETYADNAADFHGRSLRLCLGERKLDLMEVRRFSTLFRDGFKAAIIGIECSPEAVHRYAEAAFKLPLLAPPVDTRPRMPLVFTGAPFAELEDVEMVDESVPTDVPMPEEDAEELDGDPELVIEFDDALDEGEVGMTDAAQLSNGLAAIDALIEVESTDIIEVGAPVPAEAGRRLMVVEKTLRSGKTVRFAGDVMVYGDVNAGAHIEADGNIVVFGSLRGLAHAGARGDQRSVIISFDLGSPQLRIADHIGFTTEMPVNPTPQVEVQRMSKFSDGVVGGISSLLGRGRPTLRTFNPEIVWVEDGEIRIASYDGRLPT
jgi:septum site-determining protein MinC